MPINHATIPADGTQGQVGYDEWAAAHTLPTPAEIGAADLAHDHAGTYEPADVTILKSADVGVVVAAFDHGHAYLSDAPSDGSEYVRKDGAWAIKAEGGGLTHPQVLARGLGA